MFTHFEWVSPRFSNFEKKKEQYEIDKRGLPRSESFGILNKQTFFFREKRHNKTSLLGQGAYGKVYVVINPENKEKAVIKVQEYQPTNNFTHIKGEAERNQIVNGETYLFQDKNQTCYMWMKKLPPDLHQFYIKGKNKFNSFDEFLKMFIDILKATQYLHEVCGIIHGDLKLQNICRDEKGKIYFCDFGLARKLKASDSDPTPERTSGKWSERSWHLPSELNNPIPAARSTDVYSLAQLVQAFYLSSHKEDLTLDWRLGLKLILYKMTKQNPRDRCSLEEAIRGCVDLYNCKNSSNPLTYDWYEELPSDEKPLLIDFVETNKKDALCLIDILIAEEKSHQSPRALALQKLKSLVSDAKSVDEVDNVVKPFKKLDNLIKVMRKDNKIANYAEAYHQYVDTPIQIVDIIENLKKSVRSSSNISRP